MATKRLSCSGKTRHPYFDARREHHGRLRTEGLTLRQIGERTGSSKERVRLDCLQIYKQTRIDKFHGRPTTEAWKLSLRDLYEMEKDVRGPVTETQG